MRILIVAARCYPFMGGIETHLQALCGALCNHADVRVIVSSEDRNTVEEIVDSVPVARLSTLLTAFSTSISPGTTCSWVWRAFSCSMTRWKLR